MTWPCEQPLFISPLAPLLAGLQEFLNALKVHVRGHVDRHEVIDGDALGRTAPAIQLVGDRWRPG
jgi:hypothetical protein